MNYYSNKSILLSVAKKLVMLNYPVMFWDVMKNIIVVGSHNYEKKLKSFITCSLPNILNLSTNEIFTSKLKL